jgi:hypothetical protein
MMANVTPSRQAIRAALFESMTPTEAAHKVCLSYQALKSYVATTNSQAIKDAWVECQKRAKL